MQNILLIASLAVDVLILVLLAIILFTNKNREKNPDYDFRSLKEQLDKYHNTLIEIKTDFANLQSNIVKDNQGAITENILKLQNELTKEINEQISRFKKDFYDIQTQSFNILNERINKSFESISNKVDERLNKGFENTGATFNKITEKMATLVTATNSMADLNTKVNQLNSILSNDKARGKYGEVVLSSILEQVYGETRNLYSLQYTFNYGNKSYRPDAVVFLRDKLFLCIDSKFPFANYEKLLDLATGEPDFRPLSVEFKKHIKEQIDKISADYVVPGTTYEQAVMFIPNDGIFTFIHVHFYDEIVRYAMDKNVILSSPAIFQPLLYTLRTFQLNYETALKIGEISHNISELAKHFDNLKTTYLKYMKNINSVINTGGELETKFKTVDKKFGKLKNNLPDDNSPKLTESTADES